MRNDRAAQALDTLSILDRGWYENQQRERVEVAGAMEFAKTRTRLIRPDDWDGIEAELTTRGQGAPAATEVTSETTLEALERVSSDADRHTPSRIMALNFASARNPGGGFLGGAQAQEESLARTSGLYPCLLQQPEYYRANRATKSLEYTDHAILSPGVPFFKDDCGNLLREVYLATVVTMPAVNTGAMSAESRDPIRIREVMAKRARRVLALASAENCDTLVLGAWGCGVFRNDPEIIASVFADAMAQHASRFGRVVFAVFDRSPTQACVNAFRARFSSKSPLGIAK